MASVERDPPRGEEPGGRRDEAVREGAAGDVGGDHERSGDRPEAETLVDGPVAIVVDAVARLGARVPGLARRDMPVLASGRLARAGPDPAALRRDVLVDEPIAVVVDAVAELENGLDDVR